MTHPGDGVFPLVDALGFIFRTRWLFLLQELHSVPLVLQFCLIALPKLQEQRDYSRKADRKKHGMVSNLNTSNNDGVFRFHCGFNRVRLLEVVVSPRKENLPQIDMKTAKTSVPKLSNIQSFCKGETKRSNSQIRTIKSEERKMTHFNDENQRI